MITATDTESSSVTATATVIARGGPPSAMASASFPVTVTALDAFGNSTAGYRGTVTFTSTDPLAVLPTNHTFTATDNGKHNFTVTLNTAGSQTITVTDTTHTGVTGQATVSVTAAAWPSGDGPGEWLAPALDAFFSRWPFGERGFFLGGH
jgi:hypothetical protein